jgi:hypothetical protein
LPTRRRVRRRRGLGRMARSAHNATTTCGSQIATTGCVESVVGSHTSTMRVWRTAHGFRCAAHRPWLSVCDAPPVALVTRRAVQRILNVYTLCRQHYTMSSPPYHLGPTGGINQISQTSGFERAVGSEVCVIVTVCRKVPLSNCTVTLQPEQLLVSLSSSPNTSNTTDTYCFYYQLLPQLLRWSWQIP